MRRLVRLACSLVVVPSLCLASLPGAEHAAAQSRPEAVGPWRLELPVIPAWVSLPASPSLPGATSASTGALPSASTLSATATWPLTLAAPADLLPVGQEWRLPVYDDAGEIIPYHEIAALVDPSGYKGGTWGFIGGAVAGLAIGAIIGRCGGIRNGFQYYCSPRDESLRTILPVGLGFTFGMALGWAGWNSDRTTFDEAVAEIRRQRRLGR